MPSKSDPPQEADHSSPPQGFFTMGTREREPGYNVDPIDIEAGLRELVACGHDDSAETREVIRYALIRHARGEEAAAERGAIDKDFYGISFTCWRRVLAAAVASGTQKLKPHGSDGQEI